VDINNDGLPDIIRSYSFFGVPTYIGDGVPSPEELHNVNEIWLNTGSYWIKMQNAPQVPAIASVSVENGGLYVGREIINEMFDQDGDGAVDIGNTKTNAPRQDLLKHIMLPTGGFVDAVITPTTQQLTANNLNNPKLAIPVWTVTQLTQNDGSGNVQTSNYTYKDGKMWIGSINDRKFAGFGLITHADSAGNATETSYHTDNYYEIGKPYKTEQKNSSNTVYAATINAYSDADLDSGSKFVKLAQTVTQTFDGDSTHKDKIESYTYDDTNGNLLSKVENNEFTTNYSYATNNGISLPSDEVVTDSTGTKVKETRYYYDNLPLGQVTLGNLTKQEAWKSGTTFVSTQKTYNSFGLVTSDTDPRGRITSYIYDSNNLYPSSVTNPLSQVTQYTYDYASGKVTQQTDPNNLVSTYTYDGLGRPLSEQVGGNLKTTYVYTDTPNQVNIKQTGYLDTSNNVDSYTYFDGLGRKIQEKQEAENGFIVKDTSYNNLGLVDKESLPYLSISSVPGYTSYTYDPVGRILTSTNAVGTTINTYNDWELTVTDPNGKTKDLFKDAYGNLVEVDEHNQGNTYATHYTYNYLGNLTNITDALGNIRNFTYDGLGRRLTAQDLHASTDASFGTWNYTYDDSGNLVKTVDPKAQTVNYTYDSLNRELTQNFTGKAGVEQTYVYDTCANGIGRVCTITTPEILESKGYNALGQMIENDKTISTVNYPTAYTYDLQGNILAITNPDTSQVKYNYNPAGLLESVDGVVTNFDYSPTGQIAKIEYANGVVSTNTYDAAKVYRLAQKISVLGSQHLQDLSYTYDPNGNITKLVDASNTNTAKTVDYVYDDLNRLLSATSSGTPAYSKSYTYDAIGNILTGDPGTYTYAGTGFANPHAVTSIGSTNYTYDNNGNVLTQGTKTFAWDYLNRLLTTKTSSSTYDASGERITYTTGGKTTTYPTQYYNIDASGKATKHVFGNGLLLATLTGASAPTNPDCTPPSTGDWVISTSCTFTGSATSQGSVIINAGQKLTLASNSKLFLDFKHFKLLVKKTGGILIKKGAALKQGTGSSSSGSAFVLSDNLSSSSVITDSTGNILELTDYLPFGGLNLDEQYGFNEQRKYIGEEYDTDSGLNYLNARYYDSNKGQFVSEDPQFWNFDQAWLLDPQNQNSYSYANNNPIIHSDPSGLKLIDIYVNVFGLDYGVKIERGVGWQVYHNTTLDLKLGGDVKKVPGGFSTEVNLSVAEEGANIKVGYGDGKLDQTQKQGDTFSKVEGSAALGLGQYISTEGKENPSNPLNPLDSKTTRGWTYGLGISGSQTTTQVSDVHYFSSQKSTTTTKPENKSTTPGIGALISTLHSYLVKTYQWSTR
jgi:RHS repeat-associated protein